MRILRMIACAHGCVGHAWEVPRHSCARSLGGESAPLLRRVLDERRDGKATVFRYQDQIGCRLDCIWELNVLDCHSRILHFTLITALILDPQSPIWAISLWNRSTQIGTQTTTSSNRKGQNGRFSKVRLWTPPGPVQFAQSPLALVPVVDIHMSTVTEDSCCSLMFGVPEDRFVEDCMLEACHI